MNASYGGSTMWRGWRGILSPREFMKESVLVVAQWIGHRRDGIDTVKECLRKKCLDIRQARRMVQYRSEWRGFVRGNAWGVARGMKP